MQGSLAVTGDPEADHLLNSEPLALVVGMLLDQQVPMEWAFSGPATLRSRLGHLDAATIAGMEEADVVEVCCRRPAVHRYPAAMGRRIHTLCKVLVSDFGGQAERVWAKAETGDELYRNLRTLPGFGDEKARIFVALLAKRFGIAPLGWQQAAGVFSDDRPRTVADIHDADSLARVREWKKAAKAARLDKQDRPAP